MSSFHPYPGKHSFPPQLRTQSSSTNGTIFVECAADVVRRRELEMYLQTLMANPHQCSNAELLSWLIPNMMQVCAVLKFRCVLMALSLPLTLPLVNLLNYQKSLRFVALNVLQHL